MATQVDICNEALALLGDVAEVVSIDPPDGSPQAGHCARFYPIAVRRLLEEHAWSFAIKKIYPTSLANVDADLNGFKFAYAIPSEAVRVLTVSKRQHPEMVSDFLAKHYGPNGLAVFTDEDDPVMTYVRHIDSPSLYPGYFVDALVARLAAYLVGPIRREDPSSQTAINLLRLYQQALSAAKTADSEAGLQRKEPYIAAQLRARGI